ncbi:MAG: ketoacyl-ACP synthase III, partial [Balneolaceae bacterium]|nr:ketoacyl-ACP synthase III [Balneolaceae bacterium]
GWVYGLSTLASLVSASKFKKALLLAGDTTTFSKSPKDKGTYPLFGDSGSATALEYCEDAADILCHMATDGKNHKAIIMEDGGTRNPFTAKSLEEVEFEDGNKRSKLYTYMDGMTVFSFGINKVPKSIKYFMGHFDLEVENIDFFVFHQANLLINNRIQKKLGIVDDKAPNVFQNFGNTSSGSIPLTMAVKLRDEINKTSEKKLSMLACGFGVGLSWGSVHFELENAICSELIEVA